MENQSFWSGLRWPVKAIVIAAPIVALVWYAATHGLIPGMHSAESANVSKASILKDEINVNSTSKKLAVPDIEQSEFAEVGNRPEIRVMNWVWFANAGIFSANGGAKTMKGSLMDQYGMNVRMITNNSTDDMKREQLSFVAAYAKSGGNPSQGVHFVTIMGDGATNYLPSINKAITSAGYGPEYKMKIIGIVGFSLGEDCIVGKQAWKDDPQTMKGAIISAVIGDGDWGVGVRFASGDNGIKINPDPTTYDPNAVNFIPAPDGDFLKAAQDIGREVSLKLKDNKGRLTGEVVKKNIEGAATWFPGDRQAFQKHGLVKVVSTIQYPNQMACVIVGCDKWMKENSKPVVNFLSASLTATNQIKQYDDWFKYSTQLAPKIFCASTADCSETAEDWYKFAKAGGSTMQNSEGVSVAVGGTEMSNLADNLKYFGIKGGNNYYKSVFDYFNGVLKDLNPVDFKANVGNVTPYEEAVDLSYLKQVNIESGETVKADYTHIAGKKIGKRSWHIEFESGKSQVTADGTAQLEELFNLINQADQNANVKIVGHTDNTGNADANISLSLLRARAVKVWLIQRSNNTFASEKFSTDGEGDTQPVVPNTTAAGRKQNRRVDITLVE